MSASNDSFVCSVGGSAGRSLESNERNEGSNGIAVCVRIQNINCTPFLSSARRSSTRTLASDLFGSLHGGVWLDVKMARQSDDAAREGATGSRVVLAIVTDGYFSDPRCLKELRWAAEAKAAGGGGGGGGRMCVQPVVAAEDKHRIAALLASAPEDVRELLGEPADVIHLDREWLFVSLKVWGVTTD